MWSWHRPRLSIALGRERKDPFELKIRNNWTAGDVLAKAVEHYALEKPEAYSLFVHLDPSAPPEQLAGDAAMGEVLARSGAEKAAFLVLQEALDEFVLVPRDEGQQQEAGGPSLYPSFTAAGDTQVSSSVHPFAAALSFEGYGEEGEKQSGSRAQAAPAYSLPSYNQLQLSRFDIGVQPPCITDKRNDFSLPLAEMSITLVSQHLTAWDLQLERAVVQVTNEQEQQLAIDREARLLRLAAAEEEAEELRRAREERAERERKEREEAERRAREERERQEKERRAREEKERQEREERERERRERERQLELERVERERQRLERERKAELERRERERQAELERRERERLEREERARQEQRRQEAELVDQLAFLEVAKQQRQQQQQQPAAQPGPPAGPLIPDLAMPASFVPAYPGPHQQQQQQQQMVRPGQPSLSMSISPPPQQQTHTQTQTQTHIQAQTPTQTQTQSQSPVQTLPQPQAQPQPHSQPQTQPQTLQQPQAHPQPHAQPQSQPQSQSPGQTLPQGEAAVREQLAWYGQQGVPHAAVLAAIQKHGQDHAAVAAFVALYQALAAQGYGQARILQALALAHPNQQLVVQLLQGIQRHHPDSRLADALRATNSDVAAANTFLEGVTTLMEMGYDYVRCANAMLASGNNVNAAVTALLDSS